MRFYAHTSKFPGGKTPQLVAKRVITNKITSIPPIRIHAPNHQPSAGARCDAPQAIPRTHDASNPPFLPPCLPTKSLAHTAKARVPSSAHESGPPHSSRWRLLPSPEFPRLSARRESSFNSLNCQLSTPSKRPPPAPHSSRKMPRGNLLYTAHALRTRMNFNETPGHEGFSQRTIH